jgi:hypothetical protein
MTDLAFITNSTGQPRPWRAVYSGFEYLGEVVAAQRWDPAWGDPLRGDLFFRIVFLTQPLGKAVVAVQDRRIAVCLPRARRTQGQIDREFKSIAEARALYRTGGDAGAAQLRSILAEEEAKLQERLLEATARSYAAGRVVTASGLSVDPAAVFAEPGPEQWRQKLAGLLLHHAYLQLPVDPVAFPEPFGPGPAQRLFDGLFSPQPGPEARGALEAFGPGLGLLPGLWRASPLLEPIARVFHAGGASVRISELMERLAHEEGFPYPLSALAVLAFAARNLPAVELTLPPNHRLRTRSGRVFVGSRLTWDLLPELAWDAALAASLDSLQLLSPPTWRAALPYVEAVCPEATPAEGLQNEALHRQRFLEELRALEGEVQALQEQMEAMAAALGQPLPAGAQGSLQLLRQVTAAADPLELYHAAVRMAGSPSVLRQAVDGIARLRPLAAASQEVIACKAYLDRTVVDPAQGALAAELAALRARLDMPSLVATASLWPSVRAQDARFRQRYAASYRETHQRHHREVRALRGRLERVWPRLEALDRLNQLDDLGPQVAPELSQTFHRLAARLEPCPVPGDRLLLEESPRCLACGLDPAQQPPMAEVEEALRQLEEALGQQNRRLSAFAIRHVLEQPDTALVDKFLRIVRASDLETLADVLDDQVLAFLQAFLGDAPRPPLIGA